MSKDWQSKWQINSSFLIDSRIKETFEHDNIRKKHKNLH